MSDFHLVVDWDLPHLRLLVAQQAGTRWQILHAAELSVPDALCHGSRSGGELAEWLVSQPGEIYQMLADAGQNVKVEVVLPRDRVTLRQLEFPPIPLEELPAAVQLQMSAQLAMRGEESVVDFLPPSNRNHNSELHVLAGVISHELERILVHFASRWNWQLGSISLSSLTLLELAIKSEPASHPFSNHGILCATEPDRIETMLVRNRQLEGSLLRRRDAHAPIQTRELVAEVRRLELANAQDFPPQMAILQEEAVLNEADLAQIGSSLDLQVLPLMHPDYFDFPAAQLNEQSVSLNAFTPLLGALLKQSAPSTASLDFANPRQTIEQRDMAKVWKIGLIAGVCGLLIIAYLAWWGQLAALDDQIEKLQARTKEVDKFLKSEGKLVQVADTLESFRWYSFDPQDTFSQLVDRMPDRTQLVLTSWQSFPLTGEVETRIQLSGIAKSRQVIETFSEELASAGWVVKSPVIRSQQQANYPLEFDLDLEIMLAAAEKERLSRFKPSGRSARTVRRP